MSASIIVYPFDWVVVNGKLDTWCRDLKGRLTCLHHSVNSYKYFEVHTTTPVPWIKNIELPVTTIHYPITVNHPEYQAVLRCYKDRFPILYMVSSKMGGYALDSVAGKCCIVCAKTAKQLERWIQPHWKLQEVFIIDSAAKELNKMDLEPCIPIKAYGAPSIYRYTYNAFEFEVTSIVPFNHDGYMLPRSVYIDFEQISRYRDEFKYMSTPKDYIILCSFIVDHPPNVIEVDQDEDAVDDDHDDQSYFQPVLDYKHCYTSPITHGTRIILSATDASFIDGEPCETLLQHYDTVKRNDGSYVICTRMGDEYHFWSAFMGIMNLIDPDYVFAHGAYNYDYKRIIDRGAVILSGYAYTPYSYSANSNIYPLQTLNRYKSNVNTRVELVKMAKKVDQYNIMAPGRVFIDTLVVAERFLPLERSYALNSLGKNLKLGEKIDVSYYQISMAFLSLYHHSLPKDRKHLVLPNDVHPTLLNCMYAIDAFSTTSLNLLPYTEAYDLWNKIHDYVHMDGEIAMRLIHKISLNTIMGFANVTSCPMHALVCGGHSVFGATLIGRECWRQGVSFGPSPYKKEMVRKFNKDGTFKDIEKKYAGAMVLKPRTGLHMNVMDPDADALYPSTIITYNICHSTFVPPFVLGCKYPTYIEWLRNPTIHEKHYDYKEPDILEVTKIFDKVTLESSAGAITLRIWPFERLVVDIPDTRIYDYDTNSGIDFDVPQEALDYIDAKVQPHIDYYPKYEWNPERDITIVIYPSDNKAYGFIFFIDANTKKMIWKMKVVARTSQSYFLSKIEGWYTENLRPIEYIKSPNLDSEGKYGIFPTVCMMLIKKRKAVKKLMKQAYKDGDMDTYYLMNSKQQALKIAVNGVYGFTGSGFLFFQLEVSAFITHGSRLVMGIVDKYLMHLDDEMLSSDKKNRIVYGDTDSVMIEGNSSMSANQLNHHAKNGLIPSMNKYIASVIGQDTITYSLDAVMSRAFYACPKKYAWIEAEEHDIITSAGDPQSPDFPIDITEKYIHTKGISEKLSEQTPWGRRLTKSVFRMIMFETPKTQIEQYINSEYKRLEEGLIPVEDCCFVNVISPQTTQGNPYKAMQKLANMGVSVQVFDAVSWYHSTTGIGVLQSNEPVDAYSTFNHCTTEIDMALKNYHIY